MPTVITRCTVISALEDDERLRSFDFKDPTRLPELRSRVVKFSSSCMVMDTYPVHEVRLSASAAQCADLAGAYLKSLLPWNKDHHKEQLRRVVTEIVESQAGKILGMTLNIWALDVKRVEIKIHALGVRELTEAIATWVDKELVAKHLGIKPELLTIEGGGGRPKEGLVDMTFKLYK